MPHGDYVLKELCDLWIQKIRKSLEHKKKHFQDDADLAFKFFNGPHDFMYEGDPNSESLSFKMTVNKVAEFVQLFGPTLYHTNPTREVSPRGPLDLPLDVFGDPLIAQAFAQQDHQRVQFDTVRAGVLERVLNWSPVSTNLREEARKSVDEALIKGRGLLWTELWNPPGANFRVVGSFHDSVDNLAIDPDMEDMAQVQWIARLCCHPVWQIEKEYKLEPGSLRGNAESQSHQAESQHNDPDGFDRKRGQSNDLVRYWKIYSRMGMGGRLSGGSSGMDYGETLEVFGDYVYLVVAENVPYPLNLPPALQDKPGADGTDPAVAKEIARNLQWPVPTWAAGLWPVTTLDFHKVPKQVWPMSHLKPGMGELRFINWAYSFIAGKIKNTSRDIIAVLKEAAEEIKHTIVHGRDMEIVELETQYKHISEVVQFLSHPPFNASIWQVIEAVEKSFEKRVGLTELVYGESPKQLRSAAEADIKQQGTNIRPDDMAEQVEAWMAEAARKESIMARLYLRGTDLKPVLGDLGGLFWDQFVATTDIQEAAHEFSYRIESGSVRKPNKERDAANYQAGMQILLPVFQSFAAATGNVTPINALIKGWCQSKGISNYEEFLLPAPPPPQPVGVSPAGAGSNLISSATPGAGSAPGGGPSPGLPPGMQRNGMPVPAPQPIPTR